MKRHPNVINIDEVEAWTPPAPRPAPFGGSAKRIARAAGSKQLGASFFTVPAGSTAVPLHAHHNNEEAIFVLRGKGTLRIGKERVEVRSGDWIALPAGEDHAHQLLADQGEELAYLTISTMHDADIVTYPDSGKLLAAVGMMGAGLRKMFHLTDGNVDYWKGEGNTP